MLNVEAAMADSSLTSRMLLQVHDELRVRGGHG